MAPKVFSLILLFSTSFLCMAHNDGERFFKKLPPFEYPFAGSTEFDGGTATCYRKFFVPVDQNGYYEAQWLPTECDEKTLTAGNPEVRLPKAPPPPDFSPKIHHHSLRRGFGDGMAEFGKNIMKYFVLLAKKIREDSLHMSRKQGLFARTKSRPQ